jgi:hypothetical protein
MSNEGSAKSKEEKPRNQNLRGRKVALKALNKTFAEFDSPGLSDHGKCRMILESLTQTANERHRTDSDLQARRRYPSL